MWHSATLLAVKPLAFLAVFLLVDEDSGAKTGVRYLIVLIVTLMSILAKPSFIFIFLPTLWVFGLIKDRLAQRQFLIFLIFLSAASALMVTLQFLSVYYGASVYSGENARVVVDFLGVWSIYTRSVPVSILFGLAFPLCVALANPKRVYENDSLLLCWLMTFFGILMAATLAEAGRRYHHANFIWSYRISQQLIFVFSTVEFLKWKKEAPRSFWFWLTAGVLALHIVSGMVYIGRIWSGGLYY